MKSMLKQSLSTRERRGIIILICILCAIIIYISIKQNINKEQNHIIIENIQDSIFHKLQSDTTISVKSNKQYKTTHRSNSPLSDPMPIHKKDERK